MLTVRRMTTAGLGQITPIAEASLIGEETLLRVTRGGFSLAYVPIERAEWRYFAPTPGFEPTALCQEENAAYFAAFAEERYIGGAGVRCEPDGWALLGDLRVDAAHRRQGVASALVDACERFARQKGCYGLRAETSDQHPIVCQFLEKRGYTLGGLDRMRLAAAPEERRKPLMRRACALLFYRVLENAAR